MVPMNNGRVQCSVQTAELRNNLALTPAEINEEVIQDNEEINNRM